MASTHAPGTTQQSYLPTRRVSTETKASYKTTELVVFVLAVIGVLIASAVSDGNSNFGAEKAWFYITLLAIGYMVSRGLAKSGSREPYDESTDSSRTYTGTGTNV